MSAEAAGVVVERDPDADRRLRIYARVLVTVEVAGGVLPGDCTLGELYKQAEAEALLQIRGALRELENISIVSVPVITSVITKPEAQDAKKG